MESATSETFTTTAGVASSGWPLYKISEPHESHDVVILSPDTRNTSKKTTSVGISSEAQVGSGSKSSSHPSKVCYWLDTCNNDQYRGNQRFREIIESRVLEFINRTKLEQPLVTVQVLNEWRNQTPPGRFLVQEPVPSQNPLWKDMGDKKARAFISKVFKELSSRQQQKMENDKNNTDKNNTEIESTIRTENKTKDSSCFLKTSSSYKLQKNSVRANLETETLIQDALISSVNKQQKQSENERERQHQQSISSSQGEQLLVGRSNEIHALKEIWKRRRNDGISSPTNAVTSETSDTAPPSESSLADLILISGGVGVGKTSLALTLRDDIAGMKERDASEMQITAAPAFFLQTKFDASDTTGCRDPNATFAAIISDFCQQLQATSEDDHSLQIALYRDAILDALDEDVILLRNMIPSLETLLRGGSDYDNFTDATYKRTYSRSSTSTTAETTASDGEGDGAPYDDNYGSYWITQRFKVVLGRFLQAIASVNTINFLQFAGTPLVILLDDLHLASKEAWETFSYLLTETSSSNNIQFIGTYNTQHNQSTTSPEAFQKITSNTNLIIRTIHLDHFDQGNVTELLKLTFPSSDVTSGVMASLVEYVQAMTKGNPAFVTHLLRYLQDKKFLTFDNVSGIWVLDKAKTAQYLGQNATLPSLYQAIFKDLPIAVRETVKNAALLGASQIDESSLIVLMDGGGTITSHLETAVKKGLFKRCSGAYAFASDSTRQAVYELIPPLDRALLHLRIGERLWLYHKRGRTKKLHVLTVIIHQFIFADPALQTAENRRGAAVLCLEGGQAAAKLQAFQIAWMFLSHGISLLLSQKKWGPKNYDLNLSLHNAAIEVCYCNSNFEELEHLIQEVLDHSRSFEDSFIAKATKVHALGSRNNQLEAIESAIQTLAELGVTFPSKNPSSFHVLMAFRRVKKLLRGLSDEDLLGLPHMKDQSKIGAMQITNHVALYLLYTRPALAALAFLRMVELTVKHGLCALSSVAFVLYGVVICSNDEMIDDGYRYGRLALKMYDIFKAEVYLCRVSAAFYGSIFTRKHDVRDSIEPLRHAYRVGLRTGDIEMAVLNSCILCWSTSELLRLPELESQLRNLSQETAFLGQNLSLSLLKPLWKVTLNLMGKATGNPKYLCGELIDADYADAIKGNNPLYLYWARFYMMQLAYFFSDFEMAEEYSDTCTHLIDGGFNAGITLGFVAFYECMVRLALVRRGRRKGRRRNHARVRRRLSKMKIWAMHAPTNFLGKQTLIEAELAALRRDHTTALTFYRSSILHCRDGGLRVVEAIANERLGRYFLERNDQESALPCITEACRLYEVWGGMAKVNHFREEFGYLLNKVEISI